MPRTITDTNTESEEIPNASTLAKLYYSETLTGERKQVAYTEEIPALDEAPDNIAGTALDVDHEFAAPGVKKASDIEISVYYTHTQHKELRKLMNRDLYWFVQLPASTAPADTDPLVRYFKAKMYITMDTISAGEFLKDKMKLYKSTDVQESEGFPTAE